jgi:tripartite-type tricarboxylate transporter receptor subunit TctC
MRHLVRRTLTAAGCAVVAAALLGPSAAEAQTYPARPVRVLVGFSPGGAPDIIARLLGVKLQEGLGQAVVIENKPGATGNIAADAVAKSPPDGYTVLMGNVSVAIAPSLSSKLPFDPAQDFEPIGMVASLPLMAVVHPDVPAKTLQELAGYAKSQPGALNYGSVGIGSPHHLAGELFSSLANAKMVHVPYKGGGQAIQSVLAKETQLLFITPLAVLPHVRAGKLRALAITSPRRFPAAPDVPTVAEGGVPELEVDNWHVLLAPRGTPKAAVARLNAELNRVLGTPEMKDQLLTQQGAEVWVSTPDEAGTHLRAEIARWGKVVQASGTKAE